MIKRWTLLIPLFLLLVGCSLAGDITPPPGLATSESGQPTSQATPVETPTQIDELRIPDTQPNIVLGADTYTEKCAPCHGAEGLGDGSEAENLPITPARIGDPAVARIANAAEWYEIVTKGNIDRYMPGFNSLTDVERWDVVAYAVSLSLSEGEIALGEELYGTYCIKCHGETGVGIDRAEGLFDAAWIAGQSASDLFDAISNGAEVGMPAFEETLTEEEIWALTAYKTSRAFSSDKEVVEAEEPIPEPEATEQETILTATIQGRVFNGTNDAEVISGKQITLHGFDGQVEAVNMVSETDEGGEYQFTDVEAAPGRLFFVTTVHQAVFYNSEVVQIDQETVELPLLVYETSFETTDVQVDRLHVIYEVPVEGVMQVTELWIISNYGDRTVASESGEGILEFRLPEGFTNIGFEPGVSPARFVMTNDGFIDRSPLRPGVSSSELVFTFELPYKRRLNFSQSVDYDVSAIVLLTTEGGPALSGDGIVDEGERQIQGTTIHNYSAGPISAGGDLEVTVEGGLTTGLITGVTIPESVLIVIGLIVLVLVLIVTGFWWYRRLSQEEAEYEELLEDEFDLEHEKEQDGRESLLQAIADLDDDYEEGGIEEEEYQKRRAELKAQLLNVMQRDQGDQS
ncbi:MAG: c-type cytochrome [Anaerolineales bacterium]|nr:c-type cytochrome [Anaerolineales bacterium]